MLTQDGKLTDIGSWYLGGAATNNIPSASESGASETALTASWALMAAIMVGVIIL